MRITDTKRGLLAIAAAALLGAGCAEDQGLGEGTALEDEQGFEEEGALEDEGFGEEGVADEGDFGEQDAGQPGQERQAGQEGIEVEEGAGQDRQVAAAEDAVSTYPAFEEIDADADGLVSRDELGSIEGLDFESLDTDQDGFLTQDEYAAARRP